MGIFHNAEHEIEKLKNAILHLTNIDHEPIARINAKKELVNISTKIETVPLGGYCERFDSEYGIIDKIYVRIIENSQNIIDFNNCVGCWAALETEPDRFDRFGNITFHKMVSIVEFDFERGLVCGQHIQGRTFETIREMYPDRYSKPHSRGNVDFHFRRDKSNKKQSIVWNNPELVKEWLKDKTKDDFYILQRMKAFGFEVKK